MGPSHSCGPRDLRRLSIVPIGPETAERAAGTRESTRGLERRSVRWNSVGFWRVIETLKGCFQSDSDTTERACLSARVPESDPYFSPRGASLEP